MESMAFPGSIFRDFFLSQGVHCGDEYALFFDINLYSLCLMRVKFKNIFRSIRVWHNLWKISESVMTDKIKYQTVIDTWNFFCLVHFRRETLDRARDRFRVKSCIYMMLVCVVLCIVQVVRGKQAAGRGESVVKSNLEWHRQYNEAAKQGDDAPKWMNQMFWKP